MEKRLKDTGGIDERKVNSVMDGGPFESSNKLTLTKYYSMRGLPRPKMGKT